MRLYSVKLRSVEASRSRVSSNSVKSRESSAIAPAIEDQASVPEPLVVIVWLLLPSAAGQV